jgi:nitrous oxidase accessory protein NosD
MEAWMSKEELQGFYWGNVIKYVARWKDKNGLEDLYKARDYMDRLINIQGK